MLLASPLTAASAGHLWVHGNGLLKRKGQVGKEAMAVNAPSRPCTSDEANCILASFHVLLLMSAVYRTQGSGVDLSPQNIF